MHLSYKHGDTITRDQFVEYYTNISASIDDDDYFKSMMTQVWSLDEATPVQNKGPSKAQSGGYTGSQVKPTGKATLKSGQPSANNPFQTTV